MAREICRLCGNGGRLLSFSYLKSPLKSVPTMVQQIRKQSSLGHDPFKRSFPKEAKPDYDLEGSGFIDEGEVIIPEPEPHLTEVDAVENAEVWKFVERLLPRKVVPEIPHHESYPTPSGWVPPHERSLKLPYQINRTKYHHLPLNLELFDGAGRKMTCIRKVDGDIWALEKDVRAHLESVTDKAIFTSVDEVCGKVRVRGNYMEEVSKFLLEQGC